MNSVSAPLPHSPKVRAQRGATLIEVLITMFIVAVGLLGSVGLHLASIRYQQTSVMRTQALEQVDFILEKMRANSSQLAAGMYTVGEAYADAEAGTITTCGLGTTECTAAEAAAMDLAEWRASLARSLPGGRGSLFPVLSGGATDPVARQIVVMWVEKSQSQTDSDSALAALGASLTDPSCPAPRVASVRCLNVWVTP